MRSTLEVRSTSFIVKMGFIINFSRPIIVSIGNKFRLGLKTCLAYTYTQQMVLLKARSRVLPMMHSMVGVSNGHYVHPGTSSSSVLSSSSGKY